MTLRLYEPDAPGWTQPSLLRPESARHVQVRRLQPGDRVSLFDGRGHEREATIVSITRKDVTVEPGKPITPRAEPRIAVTLAVGIPANERMDFLIEKATELGVAQIVPLVCERSVVRLEGERAGKRLAHWQGVAIAAAQQAGRAVVPQIAAPSGLREWLSDSVSAGAVSCLLSPSADARPLPMYAGIADAGAVRFLSGPEGGLSPGENDWAESLGWTPTSLGPMVLRADTAPLAALAWVAVQDTARIGEAAAAPQAGSA